jgi:hypothetical protein
MASGNAPPADTRIGWDDYVRDARDLYLAVSAAGPAAMLAWATAWSSWATSAAKTQAQLARGWSRIVENPGQGATVLDQLREDYKRYLIEMGTIPERAVLDFLQAVSESARPEKGPSPPVTNFVNAADAVETALGDAHSRLAKIVEDAGVTGDPLAAVRKALRELNDARSKLRTRLGRLPA